MFCKHMYVCIWENFKEVCGKCNEEIMSIFHEYLKRFTHTFMLGCIKPKHAVIPCSPDISWTFTRLPVELWEGSPIQVSTRKLTLLDELRFEIYSSNFWTVWLNVYSVGQTMSVGDILKRRVYLHLYWLLKPYQHFSWVCWRKALPWQGDLGGQTWVSPC